MGREIQRIDISARFRRMHVDVDIRSRTDKDDEAMEYIKITTTKKECLSKMSTQEMETLLPAHLFKRVHRSFIVSVSKIDSYSSEEVEVNGITIPVGRGYKDVLENL